MFLGLDPTKNTFHTIAENLKYISKVYFQCFQFKDKNELAKSLMENKAVFHKDCVAKYNKSKLAQKRKPFEKEQETEQGRTEAIENLERTETQGKLTRSSISLKNFTSTCFFCDKDDRHMKLHLCQVFQVQRKIEEIAQEIGDIKVLAKLSLGDMIAIEERTIANLLQHITIKREINN